VVAGRHDGPSFLTQLNSANRSMIRVALVMALTL